MKNWLIGIRGQTDDLGFVIAVFEELNFEVVNGDYDANETLFYLYSSVFDQLNDASLIKQLVDEKLEKLKLATSLNSNNVSSCRNIKAGAVFELVGDSYRKIAFCTANISLSISINVQGEAIHYGTPPCKKQLEKEKRKIKAERLTNLMQAMDANPAVIEVMKRLDKPTDIKYLYQIFEIIRSDLNNKFSQICTKKELDRFTQSANHPEILGIEARHAKSSGQPPKKPMSLKEAEIFIKNLVHKWTELQNKRSS